MTAKRLPQQVCVYLVAETPQGLRYLLLRRTPSRGGFWQGVTGGVETTDNDPTFMTTARREAFEETGIVLETVYAADMRYSFDMRPEWKLSYENGVSKIHEDVFYALIPADTVPVLSEHDAFKWVDVDTALSLLMWPNNKKALQHVHNKLSGGV